MKFEKNRLLFIFFILSFWMLSPVFGQNISNKDKPKIGLVLSGGGAKGMAHVGILRYMEKAGIRPDYIVGTSMGSVIGGLYAIGYSADELEAIVRSSDWELIVSNRVGFNDVSFEEKEYYNRYLIELPVIDKKITFPSGLIEGQKLSETLHYYTWPANEIHDFDKLPIPFRCITTDVRNGEGIVIKSGYLHDALRSSIAIPTFFTPFDMDSTLVVDGGVVNNFPVDVVREMGADIVIGVNVSDEDFVDPKELGSFSAILMQIAMSKSYSKLKENIANTDIYIKPDLKGNSTGSFSNYAEILYLGDLAGQQHYEEFKALAERIGMNRQTEGIGLDVEPILVKEIEITGNVLFTDRLIQSKLDIQSGDVVSRNQVRDGISRVFGINGFHKVDYSISPIEGQAFKLQIRVKEKPKSLLFASVHYDNRFSAGILLNLTMRDVIGKSSRTVLVGDISQNPKFRFDYYKYIGGQKRYALNFRGDYINQEIPVYDKGEQIDLQRTVERRVAANILSTQSLKETYILGTFYEFNKVNSRFNIEFPEGIENAFTNFFGLRTAYSRNTLNDRNYPTKGTESIVDFRYIFGNNYDLKLKDGIDTLFLEGGDEPFGIPKEDLPGLIDILTPNAYFSAFFKIKKFFPLSNKFQVMPNFAGGLTLSNEVEGPIFDNFVLGGIQRVRINDTKVWGLNYREYFKPNFAKFGVDFQFIPLQNIYIRTGINALGVSDHIPLKNMGNELLDEFFSDNGIVGYGIDITYKSILGPIILGVGRNSADKNMRVHFGIGFSFNYSDR
ncbi:patatin-like phospholipase family protein [Shivajiella indica]|uniref:Patatin-like phospholipase family protein n=1 Tax=Shivajiella indica TaxID=872115 RepID=A0ABW5BBK6_9BACT